MWWRRKRQSGPDPDRLGDLTLWGTTTEDGEDLGIWAESNPDPKVAPAVERVKDVLRKQGWTQTAGD